MSGSDRRSAIAGVAASMALPLLGISVGASAKGRRVGFPDHKVLLTRRLEREMAGGAMLVVSRTWECAFETLKLGARVKGRQTAVEVDAPKQLAQLADMERSREVAGLFPLTLAADGSIRDWSNREAGIDGVVDAVRAEIRRRNLDEGKASDVRQYIATMVGTAAALVSQVPRDLFYPATGERKDKRIVELPGGGKGVYELTVRATARPGSGLLQQSERRIVTRIEGDSRVSREAWSITQ